MDDRSRQLNALKVHQAVIHKAYQGTSRHKANHNAHQIISFQPRISLAFRIPLAPRANSMPGYLLVRLGSDAGISVGYRNCDGLMSGFSKCRDSKIDSIYILTFNLQRLVVQTPCFFGLAVEKLCPVPRMLKAKVTCSRALGSGTRVP